MRLRALAAFVLVIALAQGDVAGFLGETRQFYRPIAGPVAPSDVFVGALVAWAVIDARAREVFSRLPASLVGACLLLLLAVCMGAVMGWQAGARADIVYNARCSAYLAVVPIAVALLLRPADLAGAARIFLTGGSLVAAIGLIGFALRRGPVIPSGPLVTFTEAGALWWLLMVVLVAGCVLAASRWLSLSQTLLTMLALLALGLSLRRGFILAALLTIPVGVLAASSASARRMVLLVAASLVATAALVVVVVPRDRGVSVPGAGAVLTLEQGRSLGDRYRRAELANVWSNVKRNPLYGIGFGVPWRTYEPLPAQYVGFRNYVHAALLWYWLKMGLLGALAYLCYFAATIWSGVCAWRSSRPQLVRTFGLATALSMVALLIVELTATQTGVDVRLALVIGVAVGICTAAGMDDGPDRPRADAFRGGRQTVRAA